MNASEKHFIPCFHDAELANGSYNSKWFWHYHWQCLLAQCGWAAKKSHNILDSISKGIENKPKRCCFTAMNFVQICSLLVKGYDGLKESIDGGRQLKWARVWSELYCEERLSSWESSIWREVSGGIWLRFTKSKWWANCLWNDMLVT